MGRYAGGASAIIIALVFFTLIPTYANSVLEMLPIPTFLQVAVKYYLLMGVIILMLGGWWLLLYSYLYKSQDLTG